MSNETTQEQNQEVELSAQGITDVVRFLDREVVDKIVALVKSIDVNQIKETAGLLLNLIDVEPDGSVYLNLRIKVRDGKIAEKVVKADSQKGQVVV